MAGYVRNKVLYIYSGSDNTFNEYDTSGAYVGQVTDQGDCNLFMTTLSEQDVQVNRWELVAQSKDNIDLSSYEMY